MLASQTIGVNNWATALMSLLIFEKSIANFNRDILLGTEVDVERLAETIDIFESVWSYVKMLNLSMGCEGLLNVQMVNLARVVGSFGDEKSLAYAASFARRVEDFVRVFCGEEMVGIVEGLVGREGGGRGGGKRQKK